jgi:hypothetical protein
MSSARDAADELADDIAALAGFICSLMLDLDRLIEGERKGDPLLPFLRRRLEELFAIADELAANAADLARRWGGESENERGDYEDDVEVEYEKGEN